MTDARIEATEAFLRECGAGDDALDLATGALAAADAAEESELAATRSALRQLLADIRKAVDGVEWREVGSAEAAVSDIERIIDRVLVSDVSTKETK